MIADHTIDSGETHRDVLPSDIMSKNTRLNSKTFENHMIQTRTLATFVIPLTLLVVITLGSIGTIHRANGTGMIWSINGFSTDCLAPHSSGSWTHVYNQGPSGKAWSIQVAIG